MAQMEEIKIVVSRVNLESVDSDFFDFISFSKTSVSFKMHGNAVKMHLSNMAAILQIRMSWLTV